MSDDDHREPQKSSSAQEDALQLTEIVTDAEAFVRMIKSPHHYKNDKLRHQAFQPPKGQTVISVARRAIGAPHCADQAREMLNRPDRGESYAGLAAGNVGHIREQEFQVHDAPDSPGAYPGHAHIEFPMPALARPGPLEPEELEERARLQKALLQSVQFYLDPEPHGQGWSGQELLTPVEIEAAASEAAAPRASELTMPPRS